MKDYEKVTRACKILETYCTEQNNNVLHAEHDQLFLCFNVDPSEVSKKDMEELDELGVNIDDDQWFMYVSC